jgi:hypothetical protein
VEEDPEQSPQIHHEINQQNKHSEQQLLDIENLKLLIKNNFFAPIYKNEADFMVVWDAIDTTQLVKTTVNFVASMQKYFCEKGNSKRRAIEYAGISTGLQPLELPEGKEPDDFPVLKRFCPPPPPPLKHSGSMDCFVIQISRQKTFQVIRTPKVTGMV